jgi:hypothetical protein
MRLHPDPARPRGVAGRRYRRGATRRRRGAMTSEPYKHHGPPPAVPVFLRTRLANGLAAKGERRATLWSTVPAAREFPPCLPLACAAQARCAKDRHIRNPRPGSSPPLLFQPLQRVVSSDQTIRRKSPFHCHRRRRACAVRSSRHGREGLVDHRSRHRTGPRLRLRRDVERGCFPRHADVERH